MANLGDILSDTEVTAGGLIIEDNQVPPHRWRLRIIQSGGASSGATINVTSLGILTASRDGAPLGTISLKIDDLGT